ncbi:MAG: NADPH:quinone oxidoreductase family protein [Gammaproteobacteria bacterium]|jgi:NADPH2:quinone reductase|nr:NADPH:quinone oxidoreductase family protein [Gammaproteobacteria bacterium]
MKALQATRNGPPAEVLQINDIDVPAPGPGQVLIRVSAASLNFNDIDRCYGRRISVPLEPPFTLGMDVCGEVETCGEGSEAWQGKRVVALTQMATGGLAEFALASADAVFAAPPGMTDAEAASFIIPFHTAYLAIVRRAKLAAGETLLVHAGASSVGAAAIQIGKALGATVFATVGSDEKADYCRSLGADRAINHQTEAFDKVVQAETSHAGADVILDLVAGSFVEPSWRCVAREGRYVAAGFADDDENGFTGRPLRPLCSANFSILGVMLSYIAHMPPEIREFGFNMFTRDVGDEVHAALLGLAASGAIKPVLSRTVTLGEAAQALTDQENRQTSGRTVVTLPA